jgi:hypothetical protein
LDNRNFTARIAVADIPALRRAARATDSKVRFSRRQGPKFTGNRIKRRFVLVLGLLAVALLFWQLGSRIWFVQVKGTVNLPQARVMELLQQHGVFAGVSKSTLALHEIEEKILMQESRAFLYWL